MCALLQTMQLLLALTTIFFIHCCRRLSTFHHSLLTALEMARVHYISVEIRKQKFDRVNFLEWDHVAPKRRALFCSQLCPNWFNTAWWWMFRSLAMSWLLIYRFCSTFTRISSTFSLIGRPLRGASWTLKFPERKQLNHLLAVAYDNVSCP